MANTYLKRTNGSPTNAYKGTFSAWVKRSALGSGRIVMNFLDGNNYSYLRIHPSDFLQLYAVSSGSEYCHLKSNALFRDINGWSHIVVAIDTTLGTTADRIKVYVNGQQITSWLEYTGASQNSNHPLLIASGTNYHTIGSAENGTDCWNGLMSHVHFCDGTALAPTVFGSTDSTTGEWKIITSPSFTLGNNGYTILKDGNTITDQSSNSNDFTLGGGTLTKTEDCPSNVFCTMNLLDNNIASSSFSNGNTTVQTNTSYYTWNTGTLGMTSGKFYWEVKYAANSNSSIYNLIGIADRPTDGNTDVLGRQTDCNNYGYYSDNGQSYANNTLASYGNAYGVGDIIGVAVDLDNSKIYWSKNGTWQNSGVPTSGSTGTGAVSIVAVSSTLNGYYLPASGDYGSTQNCTNQHNFGNGFFGTTAVSSAGTNASGNGIFEYDVPTGYTALSTKGLNE